MAEPRKKRTVSTVLNKVIEKTNSNIRRLRLLEQDNGILKTRIEQMEQEVFAMKKQVQDNTQEITEKLTDMDDKIAKMQTVIEELIDQLKKSITTSTIKKLEAMIDIYNPIKSQFITKEEAERLIEERLRR